MAAFTRAYGDLLLALFFLLLFLYLRININELVAIGRVRGFVDPTFWPTWILNAAVVCSALLSVRLLFKARQDLRQDGERRETTPARAAGTGDDGTPGLQSESVSETASGGTQATSQSDGVHLLWWLGIPVLLFGFIYALRYVGFVPSTFVFGVLYTLYLRERNPLIVLGLPTVMVGLILLVFTRLLSVPLPRGVGVFHAFSLWFH